MFKFGERKKRDFDFQPNYAGPTPTFGRNDRHQNKRRRTGPAHARPLLAGKRESTPELLTGMTETSKFLDIDTVSEEEREAPPVTAWSNPDPYTALPPEPAKQRADMVKLIRKAKLDATTAVTVDAVTANDDFISFDEPGHEPREEPRGKKRKRADSFGSIQDEWKGSSNPWYRDHSTSHTVAFWLHKELCDFYEYVRPRDFEQEVRRQLVDHLSRTVRAKLGNAAIYSFGSYASGLYLPCADMDLVLLSDQYMQGRRKKYDTKSDLYKFRNLLERNGIAAPGSVQVVVGAKVPIVKYVDRVTQLKVDVSFENKTGLVALQTLKAWMAKYPALRPVVAVIKQYLAMRNLNAVFTGGLGGFTTICLVVSLLQLLPQAQSGTFLPHYSLGETLMEFLDLYGNEFDYLSTGIRVDSPGYFDKATSHVKSRARLCVLDPNNLDNDISGGSAKVDIVFRCFAGSYDQLEGKMAELNWASLEERKGKSILSEIIGGDYRSYEKQRALMKELHSKGSLSRLYD